MKARAVLQ